jgi:hypothetical protein
MISNTLQQMHPGALQERLQIRIKRLWLLLLKLLRKISEDVAEQNLLRSQFNQFFMKKGLFALPQVQLDAVTMSPIDWWFSYGGETPELAEVAKKILSQPISSSSAKRNWSTYAFIHSVKRNILQNWAALQVGYGSLFAGLSNLVPRSERSSSSATML